MLIRKLKFFFGFSNTSTKLPVNVNDLLGYLLNCKIHLYADDVQLCLNSRVDDISHGVDCLNGEFARIFLWATANGLCLNPGKSKCILLHRRSVVPTIPADIMTNGDEEFRNNC